MNTRFCTACNADKEIVSSNQADESSADVLSCGHRFIAISLYETVTISEEFQLRKKGDTNEKYKRGDKPANINYPRKFFEYGELDYKAAKVLFDIQDKEYDFMNQAAFLCAQAIEKYLKAFLFWNSANHYPNLSGKQILNEFRHLSHDLEKILKDCQKDNNEFARFKDQIKRINQYSLLKYPDIEDQMVYSDQGLSINSEILNDVKNLSDFVNNLIKES